MSTVATPAISAADRSPDRTAVPDVDGQRERRAGQGDARDAHEPAVAPAEAGPPPQVAEHPLHHRLPVGRVARWRREPVDLLEAGETRSPPVDARSSRASAVISPVGPRGRLLAPLLARPGPLLADDRLEVRGPRPPGVDGEVQRDLEQLVGRELAALDGGVRGGVDPLVERLGGRGRDEGDELAFSRGWISVSAIGSPPGWHVVPGI